MLSNYSIILVATGLLAILASSAGTNAAFLRAREETSDVSSKTSARFTIGPFIDPVLPTPSPVSGSAATTDKTTGTASAATSTSTAVYALGGVSESPENATTSSNADHGSCHRTNDEYHTESQGPFCQPKNLQDVWAGRTYSAIWDPDLYGFGANVTVFIAYANPFDGMDADYIWSKTVPNLVGEVEIDMNLDWLQAQSRNNLTLSLSAKDQDGLKSDIGPTVSLRTMPSPSSSATASTGASTKNSDHSKLGVEVGVPVAVVFVAAICIGLFLVFRRRNRGYLGGRSRSQRMKGHGDAKLTGDDFRTVTKKVQDSFKDQPIQGGVELQPRQGHRREDSMGGTLISPISPISPISSDRSSNAFRDEIERQRASGRF